MPIRLKIITYCPEESVEQVRIAIGKNGGGTIGNYHYCAFVSEGKGYFLPMEGANPTIGKQGKIEEVKECKIEFICEETKLKKVIKAIKESHPYEEVPIEIYELLDKQY